MSHTMLKPFIVIVSALSYFPISIFKIIIISLKYKINNLLLYNL